MKEAEIFTTDAKGGLRPKLNLTLSLNRTLLIGNPDEQYIALHLINFTNESAQFVISEKRGKEENDIGYSELQMNILYRLEGTKMTLRLRPRSTPENVNISFGAPENVDIVRAELIERPKR